MTYNQQQCTANSDDDDDDDDEIVYFNARWKTRNLASLPHEETVLCSSV